MRKSDLAKEYFARTNTNCAQAALCAFCKETHLPEETSMKITTGFGGGVRDKEICGAVSGSVMAIGLIYGQKDDADIDAKQKASDLTIEFNEKFKKLHGSIVCRDLKDRDICSQLVGDGAAITEELIKSME